jgi:hypothetical protein
VVDDLAGGIVRAIFSLLHEIMRAIFEALFRVLFEIVFTTIGRIFSALFRFIAYLCHLGLWAADRGYEIVFERVRRIARRPMLAHGLALVLLMSCGFLVGAGASTIYHLAPSYATAASIQDQPR